jgi:hypothetical protein
MAASWQQAGSKLAAWQQAASKLAACFHNGYILFIVKAY